MAVLLASELVATISWQWSRVGSWTHVSILTGAAAFLLLVGFSVRRVPKPAIQRLTGGQSANKLGLLSCVARGGAAA